MVNPAMTTEWPGLMEKMGKRVLVAGVRRTVTGSSPGLSLIICMSLLKKGSGPVRSMIWGPLPGRSKTTSPVLGYRLQFVTASSNEPGPLLAVVVTVKVIASAADPATTKRAAIAIREK